MKPAYVRITDKRSPDYGKIYPVTENCEEYYRLDITGSYNRYFYKSDCEPFQLEERHKNQMGDALKGPGSTLVSAAQDTAAIPIAELEQRAQRYADADYHIVKGSYENEAVARAYKSGYAYAISQSPLLQEGEYRITKDQLQHLHEIIGGWYASAVKDELEAMFPEVFQPERTYKIGDRLASSKTPSTFCIVIHTNGRIALYNEFRHIISKYSQRVEDPDRITQDEFNELTSTNGFDPSEFTLLPDSTDQAV